MKERFLGIITYVLQLEYFYQIGGDYSRAYMDVKDAQWLCAGNLIPADINQLNAREFVIYRYGVFIIKLLNQTISTPEVTLLLATNLPQNNYEKNAFR